MTPIIRTLSIALCLVAVPAVVWACPASPRDEFLFSLTVMVPVLSMMFAVAAMVPITLRSRAWYPERTLKRWFAGIVGASVTGVVGCVAGLSIVGALDALGLQAYETMLAVACSTPLVFQSAYITWLVSRARRGRTERNPSSPHDAASAAR